MDEQVELLRGIYDELKTLNGRIDTAFRVELMSETDAIRRRDIERDVRLETALTELARDIRDLTVIVHDWRDEQRLDRAELRERLERLERRVGIPRYSRSAAARSSASRRVCENAPVMIECSSSGSTDTPVRLRCSGGSQAVTASMLL